MEREAEEYRRAGNSAAQAIEREIGELGERLQAQGETPLPRPNAVAEASGEARLAALRDHRRALREQLARARAHPRKPPAETDSALPGSVSPTDPSPVPTRRGGRRALLLVLVLVACALVAGLVVQQGQ